MGRRNRLWRSVERFWRHEHGTLAVMFAIMLPLLILFYSVAFDGASIQSGRARLADAVNQGALAVAMTDNRNLSDSNKTENVTILHNYISYYLPDAVVIENNLSITMKSHFNPLNTARLDAADYVAEGKVGLHPMLTGRKESDANTDLAGPIGFDQTVYVRADKNAGIARRIMASPIPTDYALVISYSKHMGEYTEWVHRPGQENKAEEKYKQARRIVSGFGQKILGDPSVPNKMAVVPFTSGTMEILPELNPFGGRQFACSFPGKFKPEYKIDENFWYDKSYEFGLWQDKPAEYINEAINNSTTLYDMIGQNLTPNLTIEQIAAQPAPKNWCVPDTPEPGARQNAHLYYPYSCSYDENSLIATHKEQMRSEFSKAAALWQQDLTTGTIFNQFTMDLDTLLTGDNLFKKETAVTTFNMLPGAYGSNKPFPHNCESAFQAMPPFETARLMFDPNTTPNSFLIDLTDNQSEIEEVQKWQSTTEGEAITGQGLLRAVPIIAQGENPRKIIIMIADGKDSDIGVSDPAFTEELLVNRHICQKIISGLKDYSSGTKEADIYFLFTAGEDSSDDIQKMKRLWSNNCTGSDHVFFGRDYIEIMDIMDKIINKSNVRFVNSKE